MSRLVAGFASKVEIPPLPVGYVRRQRLLDAISVGVASHPLTFVSALPGAGKTTLAAAWARSGVSPWRVGWLNVDWRDDAPGPFWSYLIDALSRAGVVLPTAGRPSRGGDVGRDFVVRLTADLHGLGVPVVLVLDQDDALTDPGVLEDLDFLLRHASDRLRLVLSARADPRLPVHRYRVINTVTEIRSDALAFRLDEAAALFAAHGVTLGPEAVQVLWQRTEGWAAGLQLAAAALANADTSESAASWLRTSDDYAVEYLTAEALAPQDPQVRRLLLRTSVADRVWPSLADLLTGRADGAATLRTLARRNLFIARDPDQPGAYRVHPLFRRVLRMELGVQAPTEIPHLQLLTARWLAERGDILAAVHHSIQAGEWPAAVGFLIDNLAIAHLLTATRRDEYSAAFAHMPAGLPGPLPETIRAALAFGARDIDSAITHLTRAQASARTGPESAAALVGMSLVHTVLCAATGGSADTLDGVARTQRLLSRVTTAGGDRNDVNLVLLACRGLGLLWGGREMEAVAALEKTAAALDDASYLGLTCLSDVALVEALRGDLRRAVELATTVQLRGEDAGLDPRRRPAAAALALAWVHHHRCHPVRTRRWTDAARHALGDRADEPLAPLVSLLETFDLAARGQLDRANLIRHDLIHRPGPSPWVHHHVLTELRETHSLPGRTADRLLTVDPVTHHAESRPPSPSPSRDTQPWTEDLRRYPGTQFSIIDQVRAHLAEAASHLDRDEPSLAVQATRRALRLAEPETLRRPLLTADPQLQQLLRAARAQPPRPHGQPPSRHPKSPHDPPILDQLTDRETEVLKNLSALLSTAEIAAVMFISVNTVRTHIRSILRKLDVGRRNDAVRRARHLKLI